PNRPGPNRPPRTPRGPRIGESEATESSSGVLVGSPSLSASVPLVATDAPGFSPSPANDAGWRGLFACDAARVSSTGVVSAVGKVGRRSLSTIALVGATGAFA